MSATAAATLNLMGAVDAYEITPSDVANLPRGIRGLNFADGAQVTVTMKGNGIDAGGQVTLTLVPGAIHSGIEIIKVWATGTDATGIVGFI